MTDSNSFFRFVWRLNALVLLCGGLLLLGVMGAFWGGPLFWGKNERDLPAIPEQQAADQKLKPQLDTFRRADGPVFHASLYGWSQDSESGGNRRKFSSLYGYRDQPPILNVVFFNSTDGSVKRLFPNDNGLVVEQRDIDSIDEGGRQKVVGRAYTYVSEDTNGDTRLSEADRRRIIVTRPDGSNAVTIVEGIDSLESTYNVSAANPVLAWFSKVGNDLTFGEFDMTSFQVGRTLPVVLPQK